MTKKGICSKHSPNKNKSSNQLVQDILQKSTPRPFRGFGSFKVEAGEQFDQRTVVKLANVMCLPRIFVDKLQNEESPGLCLLNELEARGKIKQSNIDYLLQCLEDRSMGLLGLRDKIDDIFKDNFILEDEYSDVLRNSSKVNIKNKTEIRRPEKPAASKRHKERGVQRKSVKKLKYPNDEEKPDALRDENCEQ